MATLTYGGEDYEVENSEVYFKAETDGDEREIVARISLEPEQLTQELLAALYDEHGSVRGFSLEMNGIEYHLDATKTTVANQEITDPMQGTAQGVLEVGIMAPRDNAFIQLAPDSDEE